MKVSTPLEEWYFEATRKSLYNENISTGLLREVADSAFDDSEEVFFLHPDFSDAFDAAPPGGKGGGG